MRGHTKAAALFTTLREPYIFMMPRIYFIDIIEIIDYMQII